MDIIKVLMAEATVAPSRVSFRKVDAQGNAVSVKFHSGIVNHPAWGLTRMTDDDWDWCFGNERVSENRARELLIGCEQFNDTSLKTSNERIQFPGGWSAMKEYPVGVKPNRFTQKIWILRDTNDAVVDQDKTLDVMLRRYPGIRTGKAEQ